MYFMITFIIKKAFLYTFIGFYLLSNNTSLLAKNKKFIINTKKSSLEWEGKKIIKKYGHNGFVKIKSGIIEKKGKFFTGNIIIDMNSIVCTDIKEKKYNKKLVDHLKSNDFFQTLKYPTAHIKIHKIEKQKTKNYLIKSTITIRNISKKINFPAKLIFNKKEIIARGKLKLDRTLFEVRYGSGKFFKSLGDKIIDDIFTISFSIVAK